MGMPVLILLFSWFLTHTEDKWDGTSGECGAVIEWESRKPERKKFHKFALD